MKSLMRFLGALLFCALSLGANAQEVTSSSLFNLAPGLSNTLGTQNGSPLTSGQTLYTQIWNFSYSANHTVVSTEMGGLIFGTGSSNWTLTLPAANSAGFQQGQSICVEQDGTGVLTISSPGSTAVVGITSLTQYGFTCAVSDGAVANTWHSSGYGGGLALITALSARFSTTSNILDIAAASITSAYLGAGAAQANISSGTITAAQLAAGAASSNIGAFGGDVTGSAPTLSVVKVGGNANVAFTDANQSFSKGQATAPVALTYVGSGTTTIDFSASNAFTATLTGSTSQIGNPSNVKAGQCGQIYFTQDGTGGRLLTWASNWKFSGGVAPTLSTGAGAVDVLSFCAKTTSFVVGTLLANVL